MLVQNIECRIAQAQMGRYLGGLGLSDEAVSQLDSHIRSCNECSSALRTRRVELEALIALPKEEFPALEEIIHQTPAKPRLVDALRAIVTTEEKPKPNAKPIAYSAALTILLVAMSFVAKDPTRLFGDRASTSGNKVQFPRIESQPVVSTGNSSAIVIKPEPSTIEVPFYLPPLFESLDFTKPLPSEKDFENALTEYSKRTRVEQTPVIARKAVKKPSRNSVRVTKPKKNNFINIVEG